MEVCKEQGVPEPTYEDRGGFIYIIFKRKAYIQANDTQNDTQEVGNDTQGMKNDTQEVRNDTQDHIIPPKRELDKWIEEQIRKNNNISTEQLAKMSGRSIITIKRHLSMMKHIKFVGSGFSGHWEIKE